MKDYLEQLKEELERKVNDYSIDFVNEHDVNDSQYGCDAFTEFADNNTSIYYSDQRDYYYKNSSDCDDALLSMYDADSIAQMIRDRGVDAVVCQAGACGEYDAIYRALSEDEEEIKKLLVVKYFIENFDGLNLTKERIDRALDEVESVEIYNGNISNLGDAIDSLVEEWQDEDEEEDD